MLLLLLYCEGEKNILGGENKKGGLIGGRDTQGTRLQQAASCFFSQVRKDPVAYGLVLGWLAALGKASGTVACTCSMDKHDGQR